MARCAICDASDNPLLTNTTPYSRRRSFRDHPQHAHLQICSVCDDSRFTSDDDMDNPLEGEIAILTTSGLDDY